MKSLARSKSGRGVARLATGPGTVAGSAAPCGAFAHLPVVPGESPHEWDGHRAGVVASLAPVGLLEVNLAERAALLLWRLARLARFEAGTTSAAVEDAGLLPPGADPFAAVFHPQSLNADNYLKLTEQSLRAARLNLAELAAEAELLGLLEGMSESEACPAEVVLGLLGWAHGEVYECPFRRSNPTHHSEAGFCAEVGLPGAAAREVAWTPTLAIKALDHLGRAAGQPPAEFRPRIRRAIQARVAALERDVRRLEADAAAIVRRDEDSRGRAADAALLPPTDLVGRVIEYEKHLHAQLSATIRELERSQDRRRLTPTVANLRVTVATPFE